MSPPIPCGPSTRAASRDTRNDPFAITSCCRSQSAAVVSSSGLEMDSPAMRGADPAIVLVPGVGMFSYGANKQTARVAGEFYVNAINVMRGAEAVSSYSPIPEREKFRIE